MKPDMTPMMDVCFQLIIFFVLLMTVAKDENAQRVKLPLAKTPPIIEDEQVPNSININVDPDARLWGWGEILDLRSPAGVQRFRQLMRLQSDALKERQKREKQSDWRVHGLETTVIVRVSEDVEFDVFRKIMEIAREMGFNRFQLKARMREDGHGASPAGN